MTAVVAVGVEVLRVCLRSDVKLGLVSPQPYTLNPKHGLESQPDGQDTLNISMPANQTQDQIRIC